MGGRHEKVLSPLPPGAFQQFIEVSDLEIPNLRLKLSWPRLGPLLPVVAEGEEVGCPWERL